MDIGEFIKNFADQFDDTPASEFKADTLFHDLAEYSSMTALALIAMTDSEYGVKLHTTDIANAKTIQDLYNIVSERKG